MPLTITVDHAARLISATARGTVSRQDMAGYFEAVPREGAVGYRVIFDFRTATLQLTSADLRAFSEIARSRKSDAFDSAVALIVRSEAERELAAYFIDRTASGRPVRLFGDPEQAAAWFDILDRERSGWRQPAG